MLALAVLGFGIAYFQAESPAAFMMMVAMALVLGVLLITPIGGADMPIVVSMLHS